MISICFVKPFCFLPPPKHRSKTLSSNGEGSFCQFSPLVCKGYAREGFNERSSLSPIQSDTVPETNRYALPAF